MLGILDRNPLVPCTIAVCIHQARLVREGGSPC